MNTATPCNCQVTVLTPPGRAAVATVALEGNGAAALADRHWSPANRIPLADLPADRVAFGRWSVAGQEQEAVVRCRGPQYVEIHCHGGREATDAVVTSLLAAGVRLADEASWLRNRLPEPIQRSAYSALAFARTERTAAILLDQYRGALRKALTEVLAWLRRSEFPDARDRLTRLLSWRELGRHLTRPWRVVVAGPPNVGKSSLVNAIVGYPRCIVHHQPGTTRDAITVETALAGWPIELVDTAGLRAGEDAVESEGVMRAKNCIATADLVVLVGDATQHSQRKLPVAIANGALSLDAISKCDLLPTPTPAHAGCIHTSALANLGIELLQERIVRELVPRLPPAGEAVPFEESQGSAIADALQAILRHDSAIAARTITGLLEA